MIRYFLVSNTSSLVTYKSRVRNGPAFLFGATHPGA